MRTVVLLAAALGACTPESAPAAPQAAQVTQAAPAVTPQLLTGRWGDNGDCSKDIVFNADGSFASFTGGGGSWSLSGDTVTMQGAGGVFSVRVALLDNDTLVISNPDGTTGTSQRCP